MILRYNYKFMLDFDTPVNNHHFILRIVPSNSFFQKNIQYSYSINGVNNSLEETVDGFNNNIVFGNILEPHNTFTVTIDGMVEQFNLYEEIAPPYYFYQNESKHVEFSCQFLNFYNKYSPIISDLSTHNKVAEICSIIYDNFEYSKGHTDHESSIDEFINKKKGVCQDFSHLLIAFLRKEGILAKYINGYIFGEGETHAWVEYYYDGKWYGADPTHKKILRAEDYYIKVASGRDFFDCKINNGIFSGSADQAATIKCSVFVEE